jgi:hypothetical protein
LHANDFIVLHFKGILIFSTETLESNLNSIIELSGKVKLLKFSKNKTKLQRDKVSKREKF